MSCLLWSILAVWKVLSHSFVVVVCSKQVLKMSGLEKELENFCLEGKYLALRCLMCLFDVKNVLWLPEKTLKPV